MLILKKTGSKSQVMILHRDLKPENGKRTFIAPLLHLQAKNFSLSGRQSSGQAWRFWLI